MDAKMKLTKDEYDKFLDRLVVNLKEKGELRVGQAMYNALYHVAPELAENLTIHSVECDPFYKDDRRVTQLIECNLCKVEVAGLNPVTSTKLK